MLKANWAEAEQELRDLWGQDASVNLVEAWADELARQDEIYFQEIAAAGSHRPLRGYAWYSDDHDWRSVGAPADAENLDWSMRPAWRW